MIKMNNKEIEEILEYLRYGEDADITQKVNRVWEYILFLEDTLDDIINVNLQPYLEIIGDKK